MEPAQGPPEDISDIPADVPTSSGQTSPAKVPLENTKSNFNHLIFINVDSFSPDSLVMRRKMKTGLSTLRYCDPRNALELEM